MTAERETARPDAALASIPAAAEGPQESHVILSQALFRQGREVVILHAGQEYRLRITRQNKLILTK